MVTQSNTGASQARKIAPSCVLRHNIGRAEAAMSRAAVRGDPEW
jgi:hypothetical protein